MSINSGDFVDQLLDHQARVNFVLDDSSIYMVIEDLFPLADLIGAPDSTAQSTTNPPHLWDDGQSAYGFCSWA